MLAWTVDAAEQELPHACYVYCNGQPVDTGYTCSGLETCCGVWNCRTSTFVEFACCRALYLEECSKWTDGNGVKRAVCIYVP